ncbi:MAG TPA: glycoside hydrolase family 88 protein [Terracidiphilus sp.]|nr:glycoside hydrolase family 88 protein [Terracidiphilus sp.]
MRKPKSLLKFAIFPLVAAALAVQAQTAPLPWSQRMANAAIRRWPDGRFAPAGAKWSWNYELGTLLEGMDAVWTATENPRYLNYIRSSVDQFVNADGTISTYVPAEHQLDNILLGRQLLLLYRVTLDKRYAKAATFLFEQLQQQPRTPGGGFWHKERYPNQMWLDGLYMAEPFYAEYASSFPHPEAFNDIALQFNLIYTHVHDERTGLLYHGWDESKKERWANPKTGDSSAFWARGVGWYMMALVDTLPDFPAEDAGRATLKAQLTELAAAVARYQDPKTGLWYEVLNKPDAEGNYLEASASCMFVYAFVRAVRLGYLPASYMDNAKRGYAGVLSRFVTTGADGEVSLTGTVKSAGLGGKPYRDGSYAYYVGEKTVNNDPKGIGAFLLASTEMEAGEHVKPGNPHDTGLTETLLKTDKGSDPAGR